MISPALRRDLKARAHGLVPVVWIADSGLSDAHIAEVERALSAHELIKVRAAGLARELREAVMAELCARCTAQPVQHIGKVLVLYRKGPEAETAARDAIAGASPSRPKDSTRANRGKQSLSRRRPRRT